jgi:poly-gamma-glutamate synthesis protein (capsule biosynthesis protein)
MPEAWASALRDAVAATPNLEGPNGAQSIRLVNGDESGNAGIAVVAPEADGYAIAQRYFGVVAPFDTIEDDIALDEVRSRWQGGGAVFTTQEGLGLLPAILGEAGDGVSAVDGAEMIARLEENRDAIGILPFDGLDPRFKVLTVDGANLLSNQLEAGTWPLVAEVHVSGEGAGTVAAALAPAIGAWTNRDPSAMTQLVMTGVTAMARGTAEAMEREGFTYPAEIIGPELATADITHVSNEIPFIDGCEVRNFEDNLVLCSDLPYWQALELMGTDIVGLSGNHVNDFGRDGARQSLTWYRENNIPIYGSGFNTEEACAPLLWEHNGNTFAFLAALAFDPVSAQATDSEPGACYFYDNKERIIRSIESLSEAVDVVAVELQYEETYVPYPTPNQVDEFRELRAAGADLVTGVQSHVPQAQEPYGRGEAGGPGMISYGLGNLFFDQMWSWETRSELYVRHTIYNGEIISSEILTGVLEDFAQPRWATPEERADILSTIYGGAPERP